MAISFTLVKRGYNPIEVDNYIQNLESQLNDYKEKASAINNAIINAQLAADNIVKEATAKSEKMLSAAEKDAQNTKLNAINQVKAMKTNVAEQIKVVEGFNKDYASLIQKYLIPINSGEVSPLITKLNSINSLIDSFGDAVNAPAKSVPPISVKPAAEPEPAIPEKPKAAAYGNVPETSPRITELSKQNSVIDVKTAEKNDTAEKAPQQENKISPFSHSPKENLSEKEKASSEVLPNSSKASSQVLQDSDNSVSAKSTNKETKEPENKPSILKDLDISDIKNSNPFNNNKPVENKTVDETSKNSANIDSKNPFEKIPTDTDSPFNKRPDSVNPFSKSKTAEDTAEKELLSAVSEDSGSLSFGDDFSVINEETDYNSLMGAAGRGFNSPTPYANTSPTPSVNSVPSAKKTDVPKAAAPKTNHDGGVRPGIYKTSDLMRDSAFSANPFTGKQQGTFLDGKDDDFETTPFLTRSELDELMPTPKSKR